MNPAPFRTPVALSDAGLWALQFAALPGDVARLAKVLQGLLIHEHMADVYGIALSDRQRGEPHVRGAGDILERIAIQDARPLWQSRPPGERFAGCCRHYALLLVAMLRSKGDAAQGRWVLADAQIDDRQRALFGIDFDTLDVPRNSFLVAGDAWRLCRDGQADPRDFGVLDMAGLWFIASNVIRDVAALNNREMLPWDVWGGMTLVDSEIDPAFIDGLARLTLEPDRHLVEIRTAYDDPRIAVPPTVFNAVLGRPEAVSPSGHSA